MSFLSCQGDIAEIEYDLETEEQIELSSTFWEKNIPEEENIKLLLENTKKELQFYLEQKKFRLEKNVFVEKQKKKKMFFLIKFFFRCEICFGEKFFLA